jgi:hypothetical protein
MRIAIPVATKPTLSEIPAPQIIREKTSRPSGSVPKGWLPEGGIRTCLRSIAFGSYGASQGARSETTKSAKTQTLPATAGLFFLNLFQKSFPIVLPFRRP